MFLFTEGAISDLHLSTVLNVFKYLPHMLYKCISLCRLSVYSPNSLTYLHINPPALFVKSSFSCAACTIFDCEIPRIDAASAVELNSLINSPSLEN